MVFSPKNKLFLLIILSSKLKIQILKVMKKITIHVLINNALFLSNDNILITDINTINHNTK